MSKLDKITVRSSKSDQKLTPKPIEDKLQGRDTIYIDTEDDITSIIEKVKESKNSVIALVPPKRTGALQSVVNLKLLQKAAKTNRKKIALVTTDNPLMLLAATLSIPVAKTLNSQPQLITPPDFDSDNGDIIDGNDITIGEMSRIGDSKSNDRDREEDEEITAAVAAIETDDKIKNDLDADGEPDDEPGAIDKDKVRKVPNFDSFRKKLLIFGGAFVALLVFFVWAIWFAPNGTIIISAETSSKDFEATLSLEPASTTNIDAKIIQPVIKQVKKTETIDFQATGAKDIGEKASGLVMVYNDKQSILGYTCNPATVSAGTILLDADSNLQFVLDKSVSVPCDSAVQSSAVASNIGESYNLSNNTELKISGQGSKVYAVSKGAFTGGSKQTVKVVEQSDIDTAVDKLKDQVKEDDIESDLTEQMGDGVTILKDSFGVSYGDALSKPSAGEAVAGGSNNASITIEITYTLVGLADSDLKTLAEKQIASLINEEQKIYNNGLSDIQFKNFSTSGANYSVTVKSTAQIGPNLDESQIKKRSINKRSGEISSELGKIVGVKNVEVKFSPFWVGSISDENKLKVEFAVDE